MHGTCGAHPRQIVRGLNDKVYDKRKAAALDVERCVHIPARLNAVQDAGSQRGHQRRRVEGERTADPA